MRTGALRGEGKIPSVNSIDPELSKRGDNERGSVMQSPCHGKRVPIGQFNPVRNERKKRCLNASEGSNHGTMVRGNSGGGSGNVDSHSGFSGCGLGKLDSWKTERIMGCAYCRRSTALLWSLDGSLIPV